MAQFVATFYTLGFLAVSLFGLKVLLTSLGYLRVRKAPPRVAALDPYERPPFVTVQLPLYNEANVAARIIEAACRLRWPRNLFEVQVLDDSTDGTRAVVDSAVAAWRERGVDISVLRRNGRDGYKAGALAAGAARARGTVLAVFDADFVPPPDFLVLTVPHLGDGVAAVQARWGHLNPRASALTRAQALALDGHFVVEQTTRARLGLFVNFNGTAGIWLRDAIADAGGWQGDTLAEDIDLAFRAQLAGWRLAFLPDVSAPAELPVTMAAFLRQQRRWATGTTQLFLKLTPRLWRARRRRLVRLHAIASLSEHLVHPVTLALLLASPLLVAYRPPLHAALGLLSVLAAAPVFMYGLAEADLGADWSGRMAGYPLLACLAVGLSLNGTVAVARALSGQGGAFERTPKLGSCTRNVARPPSTGVAGRRPIDAMSVGQLALAGYAWLVVALAVYRGAVGILPLLLVFAVGHSVTGTLLTADHLSESQYGESSATEPAASPATPPPAS